MRSLITAAFVVLAAGGAGAQTPGDPAIGKLLDAWHNAAATADEDVFFGSMADDAIYLGTDATERWTRAEFMAWGKKHFERESAWSFEPYNRTIYVSADGQFAWFEELLKTWMGVCRGSGVLTRDTEGNWKIQHYNLAVTVPNDLMQDFIAIFDRTPAKP
ncbi:MAG: nuclear transport factor 2 family protein [Candidatus Krumholzibacteria bacterium]|nr:nuclear transport factor 2 family protein [Candidatus Krumholzibacteria bacterium]